MTQLAALNVKITGDSSDLQSDLTRAEAGVKKVGAAATVAQTKTAGFTGGLGKLGNVSGSTRAKIQNTSFQLQDIAVQLQGGTRASVVFAQQLPQLLGGFGALGAVLGVVAGVGIPALAFAFSGLGSKSNSLEESVDNLKLALENYSEASKNAAMTSEELTEKFGEGAAGLRTTYELLRQIAANEAQSAIDGLATSLSDLLGAVGEGESRTNLADFFDVDIFLAFTDAQRDAREQARLLTAEFQNQQVALQQSNGDLDAQIAATQGLLSAAQDLARLKGDISNKEQAFIKQLAEALALMQEQKAALADQTRERRNALSVAAQTADQERLLGEQMGLTAAQLKESEAIAKLLRDGISASAIEALQLAGVDIVSGIDAAAAAAATLAANLNISLAEALKLKALSADPLDAFGGAGPFIPKDSPPWGEDGISVGRVGRIGGGGGGGGGGGVPQVNPLEAELESLRESLLTKEELQIESYERQQETLRSALDQKLLTQEEYQGYMEEAATRHADAMAGISVYRYGDTLAQTGQFLGDMASALQGGSDKMLRISKAFGAAEALVNAFRAYGQVIADPSLPWWAKIPKAVGVLSAGMGMVNAIKGVSVGGGGGAAVGASSASASSSGASDLADASPAASRTSRNVAISLTGGDMFSRGQVIELINSINDAVDDGAIIRLV